MTVSTIKVEKNIIEEQEKENHHKNISKLPQEFKNMIAGGIAGMLAKSVVAPIDRIKILYQVTNAPFHLLDVPNVITRIVKEEGVTALWKGNTATMIRVFPYAGIQFMVFNKCKSYIISCNNNEQNGRNGAYTSQRIVTNDKVNLTPVESLVAGSAAGAVSVLFTYPLDLTRAQLAVIKRHKAKKNDGFLQIFRSNYNQWGMVGLFRGISPTVIGILPYAGIAFAMNEQARKQIYNIKQRELNTFEKVQSGAISGITAQTLTYPLEVIRRRMQTIGVVSAKETALKLLNPKQIVDSTKVVQDISRGVLIQPPNMFQIIKDVYKEQGVMGFYKGLSMNWVKGPMAFSISFTTFDILKEWIEKEETKWMSIR